MDIIAAFRWDSTDKSISYMVIDDNFRVRVIPVITKLTKTNLNSFFSEAKNMINSFFKEIENI